MEIEAILKYSIFIMMFSLSAQANAKQKSIFDDNKDKIVELNISSASIDYGKKKCSSSFEPYKCKVKESFLKVTASKTYVINDKIDLYVLGGVSFSSIEAESNSLGTGFEVGIGLRRKFFFNSVVLAPYTQLKYSNLSASHEGDHPFDGIKLSGFEVETGIMATIKFSQKHTLYSAVDFVPISRMNYFGGDDDDYLYYGGEPGDDYSYYGEEPKEYRLKSRKITYRLGFTHKIKNNKYLLVEAATGGEESITLGAGFTF